MRVSAIVALIWTGLIFWTCADTTYQLDQTHGHDSDMARQATALGLMLFGAIWVTGLAAIALIRHLFGGKKGD